MVYPAVKSLLLKRQPLARKHLFVSEPSMMSDDHSGHTHAQSVVSASSQTLRSVKKKSTSIKSKQVGVKKASASKSSARRSAPAQRKNRSS